MLKNSNPKQVFHYFEELTKIPRCSGNEKQVSDYLVGFAKERKFEVFQDKSLNVIIKKPGDDIDESARRIVRFMRYLANRGWIKFKPALKKTDGIRPEQTNVDEADRLINQEVNYD